MYLGDTEITKVYLGDTEVQKMYLGDVLVYGGGGEDWSQEPLTFKITGDGDICWKKNGSGRAHTISYSLDSGSTWTNITATSAGVKIPVTSGQTVQFKGTNNAYADPSNSSYYDNFSGTTASFEVEGNILSMIYGDNFKNYSALPSGTTFNFYMFFIWCTGLTSADNLVLPANTMPWCYTAMFTRTGLTKTPKLPALEIAQNAYYSMFGYCTSLTGISEISATTINPYGCKGMFSGCNSLTQPATLNITTLADSCYREMYAGCTSLTETPDLPVTTLAQYCYYDMFSGCTGLTGCTSLPATTLAEQCYAWMFEGCRNLKYIKCLATDISANNATASWVSGVQTTTGTFVKNPNMSSWKTGTSGIPKNWTVQDAS